MLIRTQDDAAAVAQYQAAVDAANAQVAAIKAQADALMAQADSALAVPTAKIELGKASLKTLAILVNVYDYILFPALMTPKGCTRAAMHASLDPHSLADAKMALGRVKGFIGAMATMLYPTDPDIRPDAVVVKALELAEKDDGITL